jgi:hypothetical protein
MSIKIVHKDANGMVLLHCPSCEKSRRETVDQFPINVPFKLDCLCGSSYECMIEVRKVFRKNVSFNLLISRIDPPGSGFSQTVVLQNLSLTGCGFQTLLKHDIQVGNKIQVRFKTGNVMKPIIWKDATVRFVKDLYVGCEFAQTVDGMDSDYGFYFKQL